jgi:hypothetical protein
MFECSQGDDRQRSVSFRRIAQRRQHPLVADMHAVKPADRDD